MAADVAKCEGVVAKSQLVSPAVKGRGEKGGSKSGLTIFLGWRRSLGNKLLRNRRHGLKEGSLRPLAIMQRVSNEPKIQEEKDEIISRDSNQDDLDS